MSLISHSMMIDVTNSWSLLKSTPNYENVVGELIYLRTFEINPAVRKVFKYSADEDIRKNPMFSVHAQQMVGMIDCAVGYLGPDLEPLSVDLMALGEKHIRYGVKAEYIPTMKNSVDYALNEVLGSRYNDRKRKAWNAVLDFMVSKIIIGMNKALFHMTMDVADTWSTLTRIKNYQEKTGLLVYERLFQLEPSTKDLFGVVGDCLRSDEDLTHQARAITKMVDGAIGMLGPDLEPLSEALIKLGSRHNRYGVTLQHLPAMSKALKYAIAEVLGSQLSSKQEKSLDITLDFMVSKMAMGMT